ncbi:LysR family transcriptional regulator substrate-binding protein [Microbacterium aurantiacum]|uniref:LysR family transcriptional regulator substrate-binding protein n=1 Tax=Microbacterium aurantiacum TaxID=162393 RepID=A0AAJ2HB35_9MICO|nr:LysR family transcriptional regulator substrate-binding protein [Microbacterium aurantiacum]
MGDGHRRARGGRPPGSADRAAAGAEQRGHHDGHPLTPLGSELFVLVTSVPAARPAGSTITAREVVDRPLCLFDPLLRARMLLDDACAGVGVVLRPVVETNSVEGLIAVARSGVADAVVPASTVAEGWPDLRVAAINDPEIRLPIALARLADEPRPPVVAVIEALVGGR